MYQEWEANGCQQKHYTVISMGKETEETDRQCKRGYGSKEVERTTSNGSGVGQKQMETSTSSLIIIEMMEESSREETQILQLLYNHSNVWRERTAHVPQQFDRNIHAMSSYPPKHHNVT